MVSFVRWPMLFIGIEIMSISFYILAGTNKRDVKSNEAAMKYFLMGSFYVWYFIDGNNLDLWRIGQFQFGRYSSVCSRLKCRCYIQYWYQSVLISLLFKVAAVPFHFWTPDVYEGVVITAFMSTLGKVASFAAFYRLFSSCFGSQMSLFIWVLEAIIGFDYYRGYILCFETRFIESEFQLAIPN